MPWKLTANQRLAFCEALMKLSEDRPVTWSVAIDSVAWQLGMSTEEAIVLADDCQQAGLVRHDVPEGLRGQRLPHSMTLTVSGRNLATKSRA